MVKSPLEITPLGGLGEFGLNMMAFRMGDSLMIVDAGLMFPGYEAPGVDVILPDTSYLDAHRSIFKGVVLTHGHEDHIGALPYLLRNHRVPVYGTKLTLGICRRRLEEHGLLGSVELTEITPGERFSVGSFGIEFIHVSHSLADAVALAIETPYGTVLHTGDFKVDEAPPVGLPMDLNRFAEHGRNGVLCLLSDSTNSEVPGRTGAERSVEPAFDQVLGQTRGRVILTCFASSSHRIQVAIDLAVKHGRKVALVGRSMTENFRIARELGYAAIPEGVLWAVEDLDQIPPAKQLVITAGSQGESMSALAQIASGNHRFVSVGPGDAVILSARVIPGNEKAVNRIVNELFRLGADVIYPPKAKVHVSGHGSAEDLSIVLELVKPRYFIPIHGEWRQLYTHARLARESGHVRDDVLLTEDGNIVQFDEDGGAIAGTMETGQVLVDGSGLGLVDDCVVRDRRRLSGTGVVVPVVAFSAENEPDVSDILSRGFNESDEGEAVLGEAHDAMLDAIRNVRPGERNEAAIEELVEATLKRFFRKRGVRRPIILPVILRSDRA
jgi:ribonuclease J